MLRFAFVSILFGLLIFSMPIFGQKMSKEQEKVWKKRKKSMPIEEFKKKIEGYEIATEEVTKLEAQVNNTTQTIEEQKQEIESLKQALAEAKAEKENASNAAESESARDDYSKGTVYRVQVGAFRNKDLMKFTEHKRFHAEEDEDGVKKYTIAAFRDYWEADLFKKYLREMGVSDAWIVAYKDGVRVQIESVLSATDQEMVKSGGTMNDDID